MNPPLESVSQPGLNRRDFLRTGALALIPALVPTPVRAQYSTPDAPLDARQRNANSPNARPPQLKNVTLEMSIKPFKDLREDAVRGVAAELFRQWDGLTREAGEVSVMLWTSDGSEILDYNGKMDDPFDWARYIGLANVRSPVPNDPDLKSLHSKAHLYTPDPVAMTYGKLRMIVRLLKEVGRQSTGLPIRVGATFDPGPEFAHSSFKYERHNEVCLGSYHLGPASFVVCYGVLKGDTRPYAGFPSGIPDGTPFGTFFGRQCQHFLTDLGFDYIWFSNGYGFGRETWKATGPLFDGQKFDAAPAAELRQKVLDSWRLFRLECPDILIETRGTNLLTGSDLATNATPLKELYDGGFNFVPPPNSPWAAIDGDVGLEIAGYMSRIAELPGDERFPYRFYSHDPWWLNSPWLDRYGREPFDIYLPLAVSRITRTGRVETPNSIAFLTVDNSLGEMPDKVPSEIIPYIREALDHSPDAPGPIVWVYPLEEYEAMTFGADSRLAEPYFGDWYIRSAMNNGFPLNTVVSSSNYVSAAQKNPRLFGGSILLAPVPDQGTTLAASLLAHVNAGGGLLLYGPLAHAGGDLLGQLNLGTASPIEGECTVAVQDNPDELSDTPYSTRLLHRSVFCAGGIEAVLANPADPATQVIAWAEQGGNRRVAALSRQVGAGRIGWVRGTNSNRHIEAELLPKPDDPMSCLPGDLLLRFTLNSFGYHIGISKRSAAQRNPVLTIARHANGFFVSGYNRDWTCDLKLRFPQGVPLFVGTETYLQDGRCIYRLPRSWHRECRVFIEQAKGEVGCIEQCSVEIGVTRRLRLAGLDQALLRFYPEPGFETTVRFLRNPVDPFQVGDFLTATPHSDPSGDYLTVGPVTGPLLISW